MNLSEVHISAIYRSKEMFKGKVSTFIFFTANERIS